MTPKHGYVIIPSLQVVHNLSICLCELNSVGQIIDSCLVGDNERLLLNQALLLDDSMDESFKDFESCKGMLMGFDIRSIDHRIATIEELTNISSIVLPKYKLATWVQFFEST